MVGRCGHAAPIHRRKRPRCPRSVVKRSAVIGEDEEWGQPSIVNGHWERERSRSFLGRDLCPKGPFIELLLKSDIFIFCLLSSVFCLLSSVSKSSVSSRREAGFAKHGAGRSMDGLEQDAPVTMKMWAGCPLSLKDTGRPCPSLKKQLLPPPLS